MALGSIEHSFGLAQSQRQGLFAKHMLAMLGRLDRPLGVQAVGQRNVHRLNFLVPQQRLIAAVMSSDAMRRREGGRPVRSTARHGNDSRRAGRRHIPRELPGDVGAAEDADAREVGVEPSSWVGWSAV